MYKGYGYNPNIKLRWYGIAIGENIFRTIRLDKYFYILIAGSILGFFVAVWDPVLLAIYPLLCIFDIFSILIIAWYHLNGELMEFHTLISLKQKISRLQFWNQLFNSPLSRWQKIKAYLRNYRNN